jgi:hypothetical protein
MRLARRRAPDTLAAPGQRLQHRRMSAKRKDSSRQGSVQDVAVATLHCLRRRQRRRNARGEYADAMEAA